MLESQIQKSIIKYLTAHNIYFVKTVRSNRRGVPDLIICLEGLFVAVEIKTQKGRVSPLQNVELCAIIRSQGEAFVTRSLEDFKEKILFIKDKYGKHTRHTS